MLDGAAKPQAGGLDCQCLLAHVQMLNMHPATTRPMSMDDSGQLL